MPAGARPGILVHSVFEELDFHAPAARRRALVESVLARYGESTELADDLTAAVGDVLEAPLPRWDRQAHVKTIDRPIHTSPVPPFGNRLLQP